MKFFINSKQFFQLALVTLMQQVMVAGSTYFLIKLTTSQANSRDFLMHLFGFLTCLTLVYLPVSLQKYFQDKWVLALQKKYLSSFRQNYQGRIDLLGSVSTENEKFGFMQREAFHVIDQITFYWTDLLTTLLNVILNIIVIGTALESTFFGAYATSFIIYGVFATLFATPMAKWSAQNQNARVTHACILNKVWTTLLIGNRINTDQLYQAENNLFADLKDTLLKNRRRTEAVQLITTFMTMAPVIGLLVYLMLQNLQNPIALLPLIATLHRQVQIIQHIEVIGTLGLHYHSMKSLVSGFKASLIAPDKTDLTQRMKQELIQMSTNNNRTLITGPNGAGKSTWLKLKKQELGENAIYIPAKTDVFFNEISDEMSTGQRAMAILNHVEKANFKNQVFLLDEWDANLDANNREVLHAIVEKIAQNNLVYEVRHG